MLDSFIMVISGMQTTFHAYYINHPKGPGQTFVLQTNVHQSKYVIVQITNRNIYYQCFEKNNICYSNPNGLKYPFGR